MLRHYRIRNLVLVSYAIVSYTFTEITTATTADFFNNTLDTSNVTTESTSNSNSNDNIYSYSNGVVIDDDDTYYDPNDVPPGMLYHFSLPSFLLSLKVARRATQDGVGGGGGLIEFQDELHDTITIHLENFYKEKLLTRGIGLPLSLEIDLETSKVLWKELSVQPSYNNLDVVETTTTTIVQTRTSASSTSTTISPNDNNTAHTGIIAGGGAAAAASPNVVFLTEYEIRGNYSCGMYVEISPIKSAKGRGDSSSSPKPIHVTQSLMDLFFLEAFQPNQQWDILLGFGGSGSSTTGSSSSAISDMNITVLNMENLYYVHNDKSHQFQNTDNGFLDRASNNNNSSKNRSIDHGTTTITPAMIVGVVFSTFFFITVLSMLAYLCIFMNNDISKYFKGNGSIKKLRKKKVSNTIRDGSGSSVIDAATDNSTTTGCYSVDSPTSSYSSSSSADNNEEGVQQQYLDAWADSITSIPLWNANTDDVCTTGKKRKKKKCGRPVVAQVYFRPGHEHSSFLDCIEEADSESCCSTSIRTARSSIENNNNSSHRSPSSIEQQNHRWIHSGGGDGNNAIDPSPSTIPDEHGLNSQEPTRATTMTNDDIEFVGHTTVRNSNPLLLPNLYDTSITSTPGSQQGPSNDNMANNKLLEDISLFDIVSVPSSSDVDDDDSEETTGYNDNLRYCYV